MLSTIGNYYERLVIDRLRHILQGRVEADDDDYIDDVACIALNYLPPRYVRFSVDLVSRLGDEERLTMNQEVIDAVDFAMTTIHRRNNARTDDR